MDVILAPFISGSADGIPVSCCAAPFPVEVGFTAPTGVQKKRPCRARRHAQAPEFLSPTWLENNADRKQVDPVLKIESFPFEPGEHTWRESKFHTRAKHGLRRVG